MCQVVLNILKYFSKEARARRVLKRLRKLTKHYRIEYDWDPVEEFEMQVALGVIKSREDAFEYANNTFEWYPQHELVRKWLDIMWPRRGTDWAGPR